MYELQLEQFSGPIDKLLGLIEEKKMEITELSLAEVTADFLRYLETLKNTEEVQSSAAYRILADFIVVASQLLLIKSKALLPNFVLTGEEEKSIKDLESRLRFYQQFKPAMNYLKKFWEQNNVSFSRPLFTYLVGRPANGPIIFYPAENIKIDELHKRIKEIFGALQQFSGQSQTIKSSAVSLEEKIQEILNRLKNVLANEQKSGPGLGFGELMKEKPRSEIIVLFLAILHLLIAQSIKVEQKNKFEEIIIKNGKE